MDSLTVLNYDDIEEKTTNIQNSITETLLLQEKTQPFCKRCIKDLYLLFAFITIGVCVSVVTYFVIKYS
jgi:hypothetical protein